MGVFPKPFVSGAKRGMIGERSLSPLTIYGTGTENVDENVNPTYDFLDH